MAPGIRLLALALWLVPLGCSPAAPPLDPPARPDVVLVSIDSLRPDHLGAYGYPKPTSPRIDALAAAGVRFETAVSTTSWTLPSHAALFTGLYDSAHGVLFDGRRLGDEHDTLAEAFGAAGYRTAGFFGGPYLHPAFGLAQGFDTYQSCMTKLDDALPDDQVRREARGGIETAHADITGPRTAEEVERWLEGVDERPFFLFLHLWDVHYDYIAPKRYVDMFDPDYTGTLTGAGYWKNPRIDEGISERDLEHVRALYDAEIRFTDDILGRILDALAARGRLERTLLVITADHGEEFFEHGFKGHRRTLYDEVLLVPLIFHWPAGLHGGRVVPDPVRLIDVMPTLLSLAGVPLSSPVQGRDLTPLLRGESLPPADAMSELRLRRRHLRSLRTADRKLKFVGEGGFLYYDLENDPGETEPLPERTEGFRAAVETLGLRMREARSFRGGLGERSARPSTPSEEIRRQLESLGYVDDPDDEPDAD